MWKDTNQSLLVKKIFLIFTLIKKEYHLNGPWLRELKAGIKVTEHCLTQLLLLELMSCIVAKTTHLLYHNDQKYLW